MKVSALIPAKGFANAKQRLAPLLDASERELLAEAMLRDVLSQVLMARGLDQTFVVTGDARVSEIAMAAGAEAIRERQERGETEAVLFALGRMKQKGVKAALVVPADLPLLRAADIELLLEPIAGHEPGPFALLVPSHDRMGTNALLLCPPDLIALRFGYDSFPYHLSRVAAQGLPLRVLDNENIALDIDEPKDLLEFVARVRDSCSQNEHEHDSRARMGETYARVLELEMIRDSVSASRSGRL